MAPITLIDRERLLGLPIEHGIVIKKRPVALWEVDAAVLEKQTEAEMPARKDMTDG